MKKIKNKFISTEMTLNDYNEARYDIFRVNNIRQFLEFNAVLKFYCLFDGPCPVKITENY